MNDYRDSDEAPPSVNRDEYRSSVQRPSHVWSNSKRSMVEDPEIQQLKASLARPQDVRKIRDRNQNLMRNMVQQAEEPSQQHRYQQKKRFRTTALMLGRVPAVEAPEPEQRLPSRQSAFQMSQEPENFEESIDRSSSNRSTGRGAARNMLMQKHTTNNIQKSLNQADCNNSRLNQSIVSENNRYSKYLDEDGVEVQIVDRSQLKPADRTAQAGDNVEEMDDCMYSLDSDPRSGRGPSVREEKQEEPAARSGPNVSQNEINRSSQVESVDKSGLSRQSHYTAGNKSQNPYEGGSYGGGRRGGGGQSQARDDRDAAGQKAMNLFRHNDPLNQNHVNDVGQEMRDRGSKEKTGYMEKEAEFTRQLKYIQTYHIEICENLMKMSIFAFFLEWCFTIFCIIYFGCIFGDCQNQLICFIHYIKFAQTLFVMSNYKVNIQEMQPNHPISTLNTFLVILLYYVCLYRYIDLLIEDIEMVNFCVVYPTVDLVLILISFYAIWKVKQKSKALISNKKFKEYNQEADQALQDILYLPQEFESDDGEEDF